MDAHNFGNVQHSPPQEADPQQQQVQAQVELPPGAVNPNALAEQLDAIVVADDQGDQVAAPAGGAGAGGAQNDAFIAAAAAAAKEAVAGVIQAQQGPGGGAPAGKPSSVRIQTFSSGRPHEWLDYVRTFRYAAAVNNLQGQRFRYALTASLAGEAASMARDIDPDAYDTDGQFLAAMNQVFITPASARYARTAFQNATQSPMESVLKFATRLRNLYAQAYPDKDANTSTDCIDRFLMGLQDSSVAQKVDDDEPQTLREAIQGVQSTVASRVKFQTKKWGRGNASGLNQQGLAAMNGGGEAAPRSNQGQARGRGAGRSGGGIRTCFACKDPNHYIGDCPLVKEVQERQQAGQAGSKDRGPTEGVRGPDRGRPHPRGRGRGRGRGNGAWQSRGNRAGIQEMTGLDPEDYRTSESGVEGQNGHPAPQGGEWNDLYEGEYLLPPSGGGRTAPGNGRAPSGEAGPC